MTGHIRKRGDSWELKFDIGRDEKTGRRITQFHTFKGNKKEAKVKLGELVMITLNAQLLKLPQDAIHGGS